MDGQILFQHRVRGFVPTIAMLLPLAGIVAACSNDATSAPTAIVPSSSASFGKNVSGSTQRILFESTRDGNPEVYSIRPDGTGETRLTNDAGTDQDAVWSPDGKQIAFRSTRDNPLGEIYVMNADGTEVVRLTNGSGFNGEPSWSKDGRQIVFTSTRDAVNPAIFTADDQDLYVMNADGSGVIRLTDNNTNDQSPVFSPDGRSIAFTSERDHSGTLISGELYLMNADGTNVTRLTFQDGRVNHPSWDPHSRRLAFGISGSATGNGIYTLTLDILGFTRLTFDQTKRDDFPSWSADGSKLAFTSFRDDNDEIYVMNADGTEQTRLTVNPRFDGLPRWSR
jgi:Tol biopolymer transport system component